MLQTIMATQMYDDHINHNILLNKRLPPPKDLEESDLFQKLRRLPLAAYMWDKTLKRKRSIRTFKVVVPQPPDAHIYRLNNHDDSLSNHKLPMPIGSSSPPMEAQWVGPRPHKMARAKRPFHVSLVSNQEEKLLSPPDVGAKLTSKGTNDPTKLIVKLDNVHSSPRLLESRESTGGQSRLINNATKKSETNVIENKNKPHISSINPKPFQNRKPGCKKNGSKPGRRLKKLSDRKGFLHHSPLQSVSSPDCPGASDDDWEEVLAAANHARTAAYLACSSPFWKKMEPVFASVSYEDKSFLSQQVDSISDLLLSENGSFSGTPDMDITSKESIPLYQRVLSALIIDDDNVGTPEEGDARNMQLINSFGVSTYDTHTFNCSSYENKSLADNLVLELTSIGLCPDMMPVLEDEENETVQDEIEKMKARLHQQGVKKKTYIEKISNNIDSSSRARDLETLAMDRLVEQAYKTLLSTRRSSRSGTQKVPNQASLAFGSRTLAQCHKFENSGISCFDEPPFHDILFAPSDEACPLSNTAKKKEDDITTTKTSKTKPRQQTQTTKNRSEDKQTWLSNGTNHLVSDLDPLDELGVPHDLNSFLNFDEQDPELDFTAGLDIPMDDLTQLF